MAHRFQIGLFATLCCGFALGEQGTRWTDEEENITELIENDQKASDKTPEEIEATIDWRYLMYDPAQPSLVCSARGAGCSLKRRSFSPGTYHIPLSESAAILLKDALQTRANLRESLGISANLIHVGAHSLDPAEMDYYSHLLNTGAWNLTFLEPQKEVASKLRENVARLSKPDRTAVIQKALCPIALETMEIWSAKSPELNENASQWMTEAEIHGADFSRMASLDPAWIVHAPWHNNDGLAFLDWASKTKEQLVEMQEAEEVECVTVRGLIADLDYEDASSWDVIIIDAQGGDTKILSMFMEIDGFAPAAISFKWIGFDYLEEDDDDTGYESEVTRMMKKMKELAKHGYDIHKHDKSITAINRKTI